MPDARVAPRRRPRQARSLALVEAILQATARVLVGEGYAACTTNKVAAVAGVSIGSLYQYFPSKEALVAALHDAHTQEMETILRAGLVAARTDTLGFRPALVALVRAALEAHLLDPALHRVLEYEFPHLDRFATQAAPEGELHRLLTALLSAHAASLARPVTPRLVDLLIHTVHAALHAVALAPQPPGANQPAAVTQAVDDIVDLVMGYLSYPPNGIPGGVASGPASHLPGAVARS